MMAFFILYMFNGLKLTLHLFLKNVDKNYFFSRNVSFGFYMQELGFSQVDWFSVVLVY